jgi:AcrR family transcriptional regulator
MADVKIATERAPVTRDRVLAAAIALADREGIEAVSMRRLGQELGVEAMALYRHVRDKDDILDAAIDAVVGQVDAGEPAGDWRTAMRDLSLAARRVMLAHTWAPRVIVDRKTVGPATLRHVDRVLGILRRGGFSVEQAHHALHVLGSRFLGFAQDPFDDSADTRAEPPPPAEVARAFAGVPNVAELAMAASHDGPLGRCDDEFEFGFGLDLILDGLERVRVSSGAPNRSRGERVQ